MEKNVCKMTDDSIFLIAFKTYEKIIESLKDIQFIDSQTFILRNDKTGNIFSLFPSFSFSISFLCRLNFLFCKLLFHAKVTYLFLYWQFMTEKTLNL